MSDIGTEEQGWVISVGPVDARAIGFFSRSGLEMVKLAGMGRTSTKCGEKKELQAWGRNSLHGPHSSLSRDQIPGRRNTARESDAPSRCIYVCTVHDSGSVCTSSFQLSNHAISGKFLFNQPS
ncbi:hypothetical protein AWENTII_012468 [Aspergillus wentii]